MRKVSPNRLSLLTLLVGMVAPVLSQLSAATKFMTFVVPDRTSQRSTLHCPKGDWDHEISVDELNEIHQRVMGNGGHAYERPLPTVDVFDRPDASLVLVLDGMTDEGNGNTPYLSMLHKGQYHARVAEMHAMKDAAAAYVGLKGYEEGEGLPRNIMCVSTDPDIRHMGLCAQENALKIDPLAKAVDMSGLMEMFGSSDVHTFKLERAADRKFLSELQALSQLPATVAEITARNGAKATIADFYLISTDGLKLIGVTYGVGSNELEVARGLMDKALQDVTSRVGEIYQGGLISQIVLRRAGGFYAPIQLQRKLQTDTNQEVTADEIFSVNIITWTAVSLVLALLMSLCLLFNADAGPKDSLLYAKFQADTSGGKMD